MSEQREFMSDTFHALAQPVTALRATVELALSKEMDASASQRAFENCLQLIDQLMQDLAVFREIASLDEQPPVETCDGRALLQSCVAEMELVAQESRVQLKLNAEAALIQCNIQMFQRAIFLLLDEMIASAPSDSEIAISFCKHDEGFMLEMCPGTLQGQRQKLCSKLMRFAGGFDICATSESITGIFRDHTYRHIPALTLVDKRVLTSH